jgi:hypothetical protein
LPAAEGEAAGATVRTTADIAVAQRLLEFVGWAGPLLTGA